MEASRFSRFVPALALAAVLFSTVATAADPAPAFEVVDVDGNTLNSQGLRGRVVVLEFSGTWCVPCRYIEAAFKDLDAAHDDRVVFLSVFIGGNNDRDSILQHRDTYAISWHLATAAPTMMGDFGVSTIPRVFVIDSNGFVTLSWQPTGVDIGLTEQAKETVGPAIESALAGTATPVDVTALSIPVLLVVAAFLSFFSPCSFPVLPAFMAYFLKLDAEGGQDGAKVSNRTAAGRGFVASLGIVVVYGAIALVVFALGFAVAAFVPYLGPVVGVVLIFFGVLAVLPFQYHWLTRPFSQLKAKIAGRMGGTQWTPGANTKLFAWGLGYGAAGFACVAPPVIGAMVAASSLGSPQEAVIGLALYVAIVIGLMVAVTVSLHIAGDRALNKIRKWSSAMKYISAVALVAAGAYLVLSFALVNLA